MIRAATPDDAAQIAALVRVSFDTRLHGYMVYAQHGIDRFLAAQIAMPGSGPARHFLVDADAAGKIHAFAEFQEGEDGTDFLPYICVAQEARGKGLATALIRHFLSGRPAAAALRLEVFAENDPAIRLYGKLGFEQTGQTGWFVRDLPEPAEAPAAVRTNNAAEASAMFAQYGFCRYDLERNGEQFFLGRIGHHTLRCYRVADFNDDLLLAAMRTMFPDARQALFICPIEASDRPHDAFLFHASLRLVRASSSQET